MSVNRPSPEVPRPIEVRPRETVMSVYPQPDAPADGPVPDTDSIREAETYLAARYDDDGPQQRLRLVGQETSIKLPFAVREPVGTKEISRIHWSDRWLIRPAVAAVASLASFGGLAFGVHDGLHPGQNAEHIGEAVDQGAHVLGHYIYRFFVPVPEHTVTVYPKKTVSVTIDAESADLAGEFTVNKTAINSLVSEVRRDVSKGDTLANIVVRATTSDEYGNDQSIGRPDTSNQQLGNQRIKAALSAVESAFSGQLPNNVAITTSTKEAVISKTDKSALETEAKLDGFSNLYDAIEAVDNHQPVKQSLSSKLKAQFIAKRGVVVTANLDMPTTGKPIIRKVPGKDNPPKSPNWHIMPFIPVPPLKRFRRETAHKAAHRWRYSPIPLIVKRPRVIIENLENAWVRLRPEVLNADRTLGPNPWAYSRKYEHIFRDDLITRVIRADFLNGKQEQRSMRIMFVGHEPQQATLELFSSALKRFCAVQDGSLADKLSGIFIYPSKNAGLYPARPKRIGMGVDEQMPEEVEGTCTPILELVEMHMPDDIKNPEKLVGLLNRFGGPHWTLAHEVAGHGSDVKDKKQTLIPVHAFGISNAHVIKGGAWRGVMKGLDATLKKLDGLQRRFGRQPIEFDITYRPTDLDDQSVSLPEVRVPEGDIRLSHATQAAIVGYRNTVYAGENDAELHAETTASTFTGILTPFEEADVTIRELSTESGQIARFVKGYRPDVRAQRLSNATIGATPDSFPSHFPNQPEVTITLLTPTDDDLIREQMVRSRLATFAQPHELIAILARIVQRRRR